MLRDALIPRARVHYVDLAEFTELLISRRKLEHVWPRTENLAGEYVQAVRDVETGDVYVAASDEAERSTSTECEPAPPG